MTDLGIKLEGKLWSDKELSCSTSSMDKSLKVSWGVKKSKILRSSSKNFQLVTLSGIEGMYIRSMEKVSMDKPSQGMSLGAVLDKRSASKFCDLGTYLILKSLKEFVMSLTNYDNLTNGEIGNGSYSLPA